MSLMFKHSAFKSAKNVLKYKGYHTKVLVSYFNIMVALWGFSVPQH